MRKVVNGTKVSFFDDNNSENEIMYIDHSMDECVWYFSSSNEIIVEENDELYNPLCNIMSQQYEFLDNSILKCYKLDNTLVWYSDCYFNPDDKWSVNSVSYLTISLVDNAIKMQCIKPLDEIIDRPNKMHFIAFSPLGNGRYAKNVISGSSLQDDIVINVYQKLLNKGKKRNLNK